MGCFRFDRRCKRVFEDVVEVWNFLGIFCLNWKRFVKRSNVVRFLLYVSRYVSIYLYGLLFLRYGIF